MEGAFVVEVLIVSRKMFDDETFSRREFKIVADPQTHRIMLQGKDEMLGDMYKWVVDEACAKLKQKESA